MKRITLQDGCSLTKRVVLGIENVLIMLGSVLMLVFIVISLLTTWSGSAMVEHTEVVRNMYIFG